MDLNTLANVMILDNALPDSKDKANIQMTLSAVSAKVEVYLGRRILIGEYTEKVDTFQWSQNLFRVMAYPINLADPLVPEIPEVPADPLAVPPTPLIPAVPAVPNPFEVLNNGLVVDPDLLEIDEDTGHILPRLLDEAGLGKTTVTYWGGMAKDTADFIAKYPDIAYEVALQTIFEYKRKKMMTQVSVGAGGNSAETYIPFTLREELKRALRPYRRLSSVY